MARNGSGVYSLPAGSTVTNGDTSDATDVNTPLQDIETDLNTPRPVVAGGTGASSASAARTNLAAPGLADNNTFTGDNTFQGSDTFADLTATTADINGGTIDGTVIGGTTPAAATMTTGTATRINVETSGDAIINLRRTDDFNTHEITRISRENNQLSIKTRDNSDTIVSEDYRMTIGASGATEHSFRVTGTERLAVNSSGITVTGVSTLDGTANTENVLPQTANTYDLGATSAGVTIRRYRNIYLQNAPDVSSDARLKENIQDLTDAERRAAAKIKTRTFTMKDTGKKKVGYIAQEIIEAMASEGLDAFEYGLVSDGETYGVDYDAINAFRLG